MGAARELRFAALEGAFEIEQYYPSVFLKKIDNAGELQ
jgi:hypothetical protein